MTVYLTSVSLPFITMPNHEKYASLMPAPRKASLREQQKRTASQMSQLSQFSAASSSVSDFLEEKVKALTSQREFFVCYRDGLLEAMAQKTIAEEEFQDELAGTVATIAPLSKSLAIIHRQKRAIEQDLEDEASREKKRREEDPEVDFLERAYATRVMGASSKQEKKFSKRDQSEFRKAVLCRYGSADSKGSAYCHLSGWWDADLVKAAHLVPKLLTGHEISYLFGVEELPLTDPRNGITLHKHIEAALDTGKIAIVPSRDTDTEHIKWICVLVDQGIREDTALLHASQAMKWKEIDKKELVFLTENRPARRFLYFRFLITYLNAKKSENTAFTSTVEGRDQFWASPGEYLEKSTLKALARNISGLELPPTLLQHTFEHAPKDELAADYVGISLSSLLRDATVESTKELEAEDPFDEDEEENDD
ncbi:hypothetical protein DTO212C5_7075 [Paecilomyces variotii]|nr:hypothetical protein DTO212C5_7075 [Paecilomyces variotii]